MKTKLSTAVLILSLATITPRAQTNAPPKPECFTCIMTWLVLGIFAACAITCYMNGMNAGDYSGPTNAPPILPPEDPMPPTNSIATNFPPIVAADAYRATQHLDVSSMGWTDSLGAVVSDLYRLEIESAGDPRGPWTNAYTVTLWESAYGSTALLQDGQGAALMTNYTIRVLSSGAATNYLPAILDRSAPQKFWRAKP